MVISSLRGRPSNGLGARPHAREKGGEERVPLPPSSSARRASHARAQNPPSLPFETSATRLVIISQTIEKKWNVLIVSLNIEILVDPSEFFNSILVIIILCHCSLL